MNVRHLMVEYLGKGVAVGVIGLLALETLLGPPPAPWQPALFFGLTGIILLLLLSGAGVALARRGQGPRGRWLAFVLFLILENPLLVFAGVVGGLLLGGTLVSLLAAFEIWHLPAAVGVGLSLGLLFFLVRQVPNRWARGGTVLLLAGAAATGLLFLLRDGADAFGPDRAQYFGLNLLLGLVPIYLLTLAGQADETEVEIGCMSVALALALALLLPPSAFLAAVLIPLGIYVVYTYRLMRGLQVLKHTLRGMTYSNLGRHRDALLAYRQALTVDPESRLAQEGRWRVHMALDFDQAVSDPETMALVDLDLCLNRARELLLEPKPGPEKLAEAHRLLDLVVNQRPAMAPAVLYWRAVAHTHAREFDRAAAEIRELLDDTQHTQDDPYRESVLLACWQLALLQHSELKKRVGLPLIDQEGRRLDAIAVAEKKLAAAADDAGAWELKRFLYEGLTEAQYVARAGENGALPAGSLDHEYCAQLGLGLIGEAATWQRGAEYLRIAARGLPAKAPALYGQITLACEKAGDDAALRTGHAVVKRLVRDLGVKNLGPEDRQEYLTTLKRLGDKAFAAGDLDLAIENLSLYAEAGESGQEVLRQLAELHERKGNALAALFWNERCLMYDSKDKLLLERKDRYYYSVTPEELQQHKEEAGKLFDVGYCLRKGKSLLDLKTGGPEQVEWALHLVELARVMEPKSVMAMTLCARARLRRGEHAEALPILEAARAARPSGFLNADEEEAWFIACRLLGDLYLNTLGRPDQALMCYSDYRKYTKSGVDTLFKMGQCYEQLGDRAKASKCYQSVAAYDHPLASDAYSALQRLGSGG